MEMARVLSAKSGDHGKPTLPLLRFYLIESPTESENKRIADATREALLKTIAARQFWKVASAMQRRRGALSRTGYSKNTERLL
ncbi:hypothetical protein SAMN05444170_5899 [Bradyrhizobium erythrophlei]|uniref:Uncharacterized protein n=1 Tax=Bradyrhizobium erythrophlei TaxID=1437360 RepID=A0A1M7UNC9_9BRAD|nr:hypothetical protein SAMN05444170_5899 [Bradyrhizobium erythrophlei]